MHANHSIDNIILKQFSALLLRLGIVLFFFSLNRIIFLLVNFNVLNDETITLSVSYWLKLFAGGIRFDLYSLTFLNVLYILATLLPFKFRYNTLYEKTTRIALFYIPNIIGFAADYIDMVYSQFTNKRMTSDVLDFISAGDGFANLIPQFIRNYWWLFIIFTLVSFAFIFINNRIKVKPNTEERKLSFFLKNTAALLFAAIVCVINSRGGIQERTINLNTAAKYAVPNHYNLVLNSSFTFLRTIGYEGITDYNFFNEEELSTIYSPVFHAENKKLSPKPTDNNLNIVVIILESFSSEFSSLFNKNLQESYTPNLDSIARLGTYMLSYANGTRSMEAIPAIISSVPTLMNSEFISSNYSSNKITSLPYLLDKLNYTSAFMHGGNNGTMYFDRYANMAGYDYYYGRNEYKNDKDYDGNWGIFDDKFLKYCIGQMDTITTPFFTTIFTLSSHQPYTLPNDYLEKHPVDEPSIVNSVKYADYSLGKFFDMASQSEWFDNTLFVITADHAFQTPVDNDYNSRQGRYQTPIVLYHADNKIVTNKSFTQQIDIMPTILDYINYPDTVFSFGKSIFDSHYPFSINYIGNTYQFITEDYYIIFDGANIVAIYSRAKDPRQWNNIKDKIELPEKEIDLMKAFLQTYNHSLLYNKMSY